MSEKLLTDAALNVKETFDKIKKAAESAGRNPSEIRLMAVTKTVAPEKINEAIEAGCYLLGENRVQELLEKYESYDKRAEIHFIGRLQTNKVKYIVDKVSMIESVDSIKLAEEIERRCAKIGKTMDILLEVNIAEEESKGGFSAEEIIDVSEKIKNFPHLRLRGLMTIGRFGAEIEETRQYFEKMRHLLVDIKAKNIDNIYINILSMGMSAEFEIAVSEGATIVRVGRGLFGARKYV